MNINITNNTTQIKTIVITFLLLFLSMAVTQSVAKKPIPELLTNSPYKNYKQIYVAFFETRNEEADSAENAEAWHNLAQENPQDLLIKSYLASAVTMIARDSFMPWNKLKYAEEGTRIFDRIDNQLEDEETEKQWLNKVGFTSNALFDIWYVEAQTLLSLPNAIFKTHARGKNILKRLQNHAQFKESTAEFQESVNKSVKKYLP